MRKVLWLGCLISGGALAVEASSPMQRYSLVGIISESKANAIGIAVLRDETTQRTLTLRSGEFLPGDTAFQLHDVEKGKVILSDGDARVALTFTGRSKDSQDAEEAAEKAAQIEAAGTEIDNEVPAATRRESIRSSLSKIIWPGDDDIITFEQIEEYNQLLSRQAPLRIEERDASDESEIQNDVEYGDESSGH